MRAAVEMVDPGSSVVLITVPSVVVSLPVHVMRQHGWHKIHVVDRIPAPHRYGGDTGKRAAVFTKLRAWELDM